MSFGQARADLMRPALHTVQRCAIERLRFRILKLLDLLGRQLWTFNLQRDLAEFTGESEWALIVLIVHGRAGVRAEVHALVPLHDERVGMFHLLSRDFIAVHLERSGVP